MAAEARGFTSSRMLVFGPLFVLGGFLAAFTVEGAVYVFLGLGMCVAGLLLRTRLPAMIAIGAGVHVCIGLIVDMLQELPH